MIQKIRKHVCTYDIEMKYDRELNEEWQNKKTDEKHNWSLIQKLT